MFKYTLVLSQKTNRAGKCSLIQSYAYSLSNKHGDLKTFAPSFNFGDTSHNKTRNKAEITLELNGFQKHFLDESSINVS